MALTPNVCFVFKQAPKGLPVPGQDMVVEDRPIDLDHDLNGGILIKVLYTSFDPYMRSRIRPAEADKSHIPPFEQGAVIDSALATYVERSEAPQFVTSNLVISFISPNANSFWSYAPSTSPCPKHLGINVMVNTGGTGLRDDFIHLQNPVHIVVGTPGRILDLAGKNVADLSECSMFIVDKADRLLSSSSPLLSNNSSSSPKDRQVMLYLGMRELRVYGTK
ncbi:hypothetical protein EsH8_XIII_000045 [Colletotrichum jinshuiense]